MGGCCGDEDETDAKPHVPPPSGSPLKKNVCCTDIIFLILFVAFWGGMIYIAAFSLIQGDAFRLMYGYDSFGNTCNRANNKKIENTSTLTGEDLAGKSNVLFLDIFDPFDSMQLCVSKCPDEKLETAKAVWEFYNRTGSKLCAYDIDPSQYKEESLYNDDGEGPCPRLPVYKSISILNRCFPDVSALAGVEEIKNVTSGLIKYLNADDIFRKVLADMYNSWREMLILCFVALGFGLLMVLLIRYLASVIVWVIVVLAAVGSIAGTAFLWWTYVQTKNGNDADENLDIPVLSVDISNETAFLVFAIIATVLTVILLLVLLVMRKRIALVVALFHEAGKALAKMPLLLIQPIWTFLILLVFLVYWVLVLGFISTAGHPTANYKKFDQYVAVDFEPDTTMRIMWWYHLVGLVWTSEFILACQQMVVAGSVAVWYFTRNKSELTCPVGKATSRLILHHIGTMAFGSFVITLVKFPRMILMYIQKKCKGSESKIAQCCLKCCICCLWCLEKLLKFLNQNAYTVVAIEGKNFCAAARKAFMIIASNVLRVAAINSVGDFVLFLGKIGVMAATAAVGIVWLKEHSLLHFWAIPVILVSMFGYLVAHCVLSIYEMVIDTLLLCFCEDCQMNDGTPGKEYFMNSSLMEFVKGASDKLDRMRQKKTDATDGEEEALPTAV